MDAGFIRVTGHQPQTVRRHLAQVALAQGLQHRTGRGHGHRTDQREPQCKAIHAVHCNGRGWPCQIGLHASPHLAEQSPVGRARQLQHQGSGVALGIGQAPDAIGILAGCGQVQARDL